MWLWEVIKRKCLQQVSRFFKKCFHINYVRLIAKLWQTFFSQKTTTFAFFFSNGVLKALLLIVLFKRILLMSSLHSLCSLPSYLSAFWSGSFPKCPPYLFDTSFQGIVKSNPSSNHTSRKTVAVSFFNLLSENR